MRPEATNEQRFIADVDAFDIVVRDVQGIVLAMERWLAGLESALAAAPLASPRLRSQHPLAQAAAAVNKAVETSGPAWRQQWKRLEPARALARSFDDSIVLLVFGKFNAGKSSLCNLLADRFASYGKTVDGFYLDAGKLVDTDARFTEGASETTSRLQGVRLGGRLVLIDTPGLHSVTSANAALTQLFTDSADAVLWLTSSTSPGQVQELDELARELHRNKPLLPVLTRSDVYDEDEVDGEIRKVLRNKTPANRAMQETDVTARTLAKLAAMGVAGTALKPPVSVSSLAARTHGHTSAAMDEAGFERLYAELSAIAASALAYKRRKHAEILLHHLEESVVGAWHAKVAPLLDQLRSALAASIGALAQEEDALAAALWRAVLPQLPDLLDRYVVSGNQRGLDAALAQAVRTAFVREAGVQLHDYEIDTSGVALAGDAAHEVAEARLTEDPAAVDYQRLYARATTLVRDAALRLSEGALAQCRASLGCLEQSARQLESVFAAHETRLRVLKSDLRSREALRGNA